MLRLLVIVLMLTAGNALCQQIKISPSPIDFPTADTSVSVDVIDVWITNISGANLTIDSVSQLNHPFSLSFTTPDTIQHGDSTMMQVVLNRNTKPGLYSSLLTIYTPLFDSSVTINARLNWPASLFNSSMIDYWIGTGKDSAVMVIDFNDMGLNESYAWGYCFNDSVVAEKMITDIDSADNNLVFALGAGFVNDISYYSQSGIAGSPDYWSSWSGTGLHDWYMNWGISEMIYPGNWFGFSYGFTNIDFPELPVAAPNTQGIEKYDETDICCYPNPFYDGFSVNSSILTDRIEVFDLSGRIVLLKKDHSSKKGYIDMNSEKPGIYIVHIVNINGEHTYFKMIKNR